MNDFYVQPTARKMVEMNEETNQSVRDFDRLMKDMDIPCENVKVGHSKTPDRKITLTGKTCYIEIKEFRPTEIEMRRQSFSNWGANEGIKVQKPNGGVRYTGRADKFCDAIEQLSKFGEDGFPTFIAIKSYSILSDFDNTDWFNFLYGHGATARQSRHDSDLQTLDDIGDEFVVRRSDAFDMPVVATFEGWNRVSGVMAMVDGTIDIYVNVFASVPIEKQWFSYPIFKHIYAPLGDGRWKIWDGNYLPCGLLED